MSVPDDERTTLEQDRERATRIREKQARGETLTREEAGFLGAVASMQATRQERREAREEGREASFEREHRTASWMAGDATREPRLSEDTAEEVDRIRNKKDRGEKLTRHEAGVLGGAARVGDDLARSND